MKTVEDITGLKIPMFEDYLKEQDRKPEDDAYDAYVDNLEAYAYNLGKFIERQEVKKEGYAKLIYGDLKDLENLNDRAIDLNYDIYLMLAEMLREENQNVFDALHEQWYDCLNRQERIIMALQNFINMQKTGEKMENNYKEQYESLEKHYKELVKNYQDFKEVVINSLESLKGHVVCDYDKGYNQGVEESIAVVADMAIPLVFEAEKKPFFLLTRLEYELLKYWKDKGYKYIARDRDFSLYLFKEEPSKNENVWGSLYRHSAVSKHFYELFKFIEWTDKYPFNIERLLNECEVVGND